MGTAEEIVRRLRRIGLNPPEELTLTITSRCNLLCRHCWPESGPQNRNGHVPLQHLHHAVTTWHDAGVKRLCLTGGEPLLHPNWQEILEFCCDKPGIITVRVQTNGTLITPEIIALFTRRKYRKITLQLSLDGSRPIQHDRIRGHGPRHLLQV
jgi:MoaA/NifB/PqqE/SkfB family radical SAM enzyme